MLTPWTVRNWSTFDRPVLVATEGGETLRGANCEAAYHGQNLGSWQASCLNFRSFPGVNEAKEFDREGHDGVRYALDHQGRLPLVAAGRLARTWGVWPFFQAPEGRRHWVMHVGDVVFFLLLPLAVWGALALRRRGVGPPLWIVLTPVVSVTVTTLLSYGTLRFRHSAELVLVVLAAVGLDALWRRRRAGEASSGARGG